MSTPAIRPPELRRSLMFLAGADTAAHDRALQARPDVLAQDLEDFTPPQLKVTARALAPALFERARRAGVIPAVRVNLLSNMGLADLAAVVPARPALILLPKAESGDQITELAREISRLEVVHGIASGSIEIVPTAETARGVVNVKELAAASPRVKSCILGAEDLAADLLAERSPEATELAYARQRFLFECRAIGIEPIDLPYTYSDADGCERETRRSRQLGYRCKSTVTAAHVAVIHSVLTPGPAEVAAAERIVSAFEAARAAGQDRPLVDGLWVEPPAYMNARRLLERARNLAAADGRA